MIGNESNDSSLNPLEEAAYLLRLEKAKAFRSLNQRSEAEKELYNAIKSTLQLAETAEVQDDKTLFIDAINRFKRLLLLLDEHQFMQEAFSEIHVVIAICYHHIGLVEFAEKHGCQATTLEPDNKEIKRIIEKYGWDCAK